MVGGAGPGPEADLAVAKARYRSGNVKQIADAYASDAKYAFVFWLALAFVATAIVAYFEPLFWAIAIPLGLALVWLGFKLVSTLVRRRQMMDSVVTPVETDKEQTES